jgi:hypothetical protein
MANWKDIEYINETIKKSKNKTDVLNKLKLKNNGGNYNTLTYFIKNNKISIDHFTYKSLNKVVDKSIRHNNLIDILIEDSPYKSTSSLKRRLYKEGFKKRVCELCSQGEIWKGTKISLILDHINGVNNDNRIENLQIVCPNCNAGLPTHCRGNRKSIGGYDICECGDEKQKKSNLCIKCYNRKREEKIKDKEYQKSYECGECNKPLHNNSKLCITCYNKSRRTVERPPYDQLIEEITSLGYVGTGEKYNVSDNAIRKWKKNYEKINN